MKNCKSPLQMVGLKTACWLPVITNIQQTVINRPIPPRVQTRNLCQNRRGCLKA
jgi:hypothetical protein